MSSRDGVAVTTVVRTDPGSAFRIFTGEIDAWWKRGPQYRTGEGAMRFESGSLFQGGEAIARVLAWEPGARLLLAWSAAPFEPGESSEVEVRFEPVGDGTRVTVEHRGWTRAKGAEEFRTVVGLWWGALLPGFGREVLAARRGGTQAR
ncbi:MAG TPA: SRPBCC domain-containing protein [Bryobacteraceae bacterium]|nr:SRPBCC domain-containing protein [Bryobacteraceae bacterium]